MGSPHSKNFKIKPSSHKDESPQQSQSSNQSGPNKSPPKLSFFGRHLKINENRIMKKHKNSFTDVTAIEDLQSQIENFDLESDFIEICNLEAIDHAILRLKVIMNTLSGDHNVHRQVLKQNMEYCISVLEAAMNKIVKMDSYASNDVGLARAHFSTSTPMPDEIKTWIEETFTKNRGSYATLRSKKIKQSFRAAVRVVQAGLVLDRSSKNHDFLESYISPQALSQLESIDAWDFKIFELETKSNGEAIKCILYKLFVKYDFITRFKIAPKVLCKFASKLQRAYGKFTNRYHNSIHAADVMQTTHCLLTESGLIARLTDLEIFAVLVAAVIHDVEHTGTTNTFHISTKSGLALLYNDRSVLEQHHVSTAFRIMQDQECDIMSHFTKEEYQDCRTLIIEMVLATDMSHHFDHLKQIQIALEYPQWMEKSKTLCLLIHAADLNHPSKPWKLHFAWTQRLMFEFFAQGDREKELSLSVSPLCDRESSKVAQSQIGFIDFIILPTFTALFKIFNEVMILRENEDCNPSPDVKSSRNILKATFVDQGLESTPDFSLLLETKHKLADLRETCFKCISSNRHEWTLRDQVEIQFNLLGEKAFLEYQKHVSPGSPKKNSHSKNRRFGSIKLKPE